jgi:hypothetical protein
VALLPNPPQVPVPCLQQGDVSVKLFPHDAVRET